MIRGEWWDDATMQYGIIHGDSRTASPDEEFDLGVTSSPYNVGKPYAGQEDAIPLDEWRQLLTDMWVIGFADVDWNAEMLRLTGGER